MNRYAFLLLFISLITACTSTKESMPDITFNDFLDRYYEERLQFFPFEATLAGDDRYNHLLPNDISEEYRQSLRTFYLTYKDQLSRYPAKALSEQDMISRIILEHELNVGLKHLEFNDHYMPVHQFWGMHLTMPQIGSGESFQPFNTIKDYDNFLSRIDGFAVWADTAVANMKKGLQQGLTYPKVLMERVVPQLESIIVEDVTTSLFWKPIENMPADIGAEERKRLTDAYAAAIKDKIVPAYQTLRDFIVNDYIPNTRTTSGISDTPDGAAYYQFLINQWTTTNLSPDEIYETGLREVARIRSEMEKVKNEVGFKGDLKDFFNYVNNDKKFTPFRSPQEILEAYKAIETRMQPQLDQLFNLVPKTPFEVRQTEEFRAASASAEYMQGSPDGSRPGIFYVPILDASKYNYTEMETLFLHEAIPGHHYQISLQQENESLPRFRRFLWYGAYGEGWALYAESLGGALGLYTDPYHYFGNLGDEIHRAIRLVVDVGLHTKGWTREQAIQYMLENEALSEQGATAEIERYMAIPGQALSYKIGQLKIIALREKASAALGEQFNIAGFHDEVLKHGCLPLDVLEQLIDRWIDMQRQ